MPDAWKLQRFRNDFRTLVLWDEFWYHPNGDMVGSGIPKSWNPYCQEHRKELLAQNLRLQWPERWERLFCRIVVLSNGRSLSHPLMAKGGFMSPYNTTLRCHFWRTSWVLGCRMLILRMTLWIVSSCSWFGIFNVLRKLAMEALWTLMVFTCLFCVNRWTRYSARVI